MTAEILAEIKKEWLGKRVRVVSENVKCGMGGVKIGDIGSVSGVGDAGRLFINFPSYSSWQCFTDIIELVDDSGAIISNKAIRYVRFCRGILNSYQKRRTDLLNELAVQQEGAKNIAKQIAETSILVRSYVSKHTALSGEKAEGMLESIKDKFSNIEFTTEEIVATTVPIVMRFEDWDKHSREIKMGVYRIYVSIFGETRFEYVSGGYEANIRESYIHPHISSSGKACWGTWHQGITDAHIEGDYIRELGVAYNFLCECDKDGWYVSAYAFAEDNGSRCRECWQLSDDCECDKCGCCGENNDNCECDKCPDSGDVIRNRDSYCESCGNRDEDGRCSY
jgi:hypothetical protein